MKDYLTLRKLTDHIITEEYKTKLDHLEQLARIMNVGSIFRKAFMWKQKYLIEYTEYSEDVFVHEMMHVFDNIFSFNQYSAKPEFENITNIFINKINQYESELEDYLYDYGQIPEEIFARLANLWFIEEGIIDTYLYASEIDSIAIEVYEENKSQIKEYFDTIFNDLLLKYEKQRNMIYEYKI